MESRKLSDFEKQQKISGKEKVLALEKKISSDLQQKSKFRWIKNGDENSAIFHTIINSHVLKNRISGVMIGDTWETKPILLKEEFKNFFQNKFKEPMKTRPKIRGDGFKRLSSDQANSLICPLSKEEIKQAVVDCGNDKALGLDGLTFAFIKKYWSDMENLIVEVLEEFFIHGSIHRGSASSFISLIPKKIDANTPADYRPISLIGCIQKIISKVLGSSLKRVISSVVSSCQSTFLADRNIINTPLILNEVYSWSKKSKTPLAFFKIDIEKAFDSLNCCFLISVLTHMGFPSKWRCWIMGMFFNGLASVIVNGSPTLPIPVYQRYGGLECYDDKGGQHWIGAEPLSKSFPTIFKKAKIKGALVKQNYKKMDEVESWEWEWISDLTTQEEWVDFLNLMGTLEKVKLNEQDDYWS